MADVYVCLDEEDVEDVWEAASSPLDDERYWPELPVLVVDVLRIELFNLGPTVSPLTLDDEELLPLLICNPWPPIPGP